MKRPKRCSYKGTGCHNTRFNICVSELLTVCRIILDSSARRFQAHKIYLRIAAVRRWAINRAHVLRGQKPDACHAPLLQSVNDLLREVLFLSVSVASGDI